MLRDRLPMWDHAAIKKRCNQRSITAKYEASKITVPLVLGNIGIASKPKIQLVQIGDADLPLFNSSDQVIADCGWKRLPTSD